MAGHSQTTTTATAAASFLRDYLPSLLLAQPQASVHAQHAQQAAQGGGDGDGKEEEVMVVGGVSVPLPPAVGIPPELEALWRVARVLLCIYARVCMCACV